MKTKTRTRKLMRKSLEGLLEIMRGQDLRGMLEDSISDQTLVDYEMVLEDSTF